MVHQIGYDAGELIEKTTIGLPRTTKGMFCIWGYT